MNLNDKNIDQLFRDAAQNSDAPRYDHSYWNEVNSMLNDENKRKRGFVLWSAAGSIVVALLVSTLFVINQNESNFLLTDGNSSSVNTVQNNQQNESLDKAMVSTQTEKDQKNIEQTNMIEENLVQSNSTNDTQHIASNKTRTEKHLNTVSSENENTSRLDSENNVALEKHFTERNDVALKNESSETDSDINEDFSIESLSPRVVYLQKAEISNELVPFKFQKVKELNFYAKLSAGLMENYETSRPFQSGVFDLSLNLEYQKEHVLIRTGLGFQTTTNADIVVSERAKVYGFGITTHQNNLSYQSLYDLYVPIEFGYSIDNTSFGLGGQLNYMFGTTMNYESLKNNIVVDEAKLKGFNEGLNPFTAQGYVWLEQKISKRFVAGVKVGTNLNSRIKEGRYFNESATTNPLYGQLTLRYNLNK